VIKLESEVSSDKADMISLSLQDQTDATSMKVFRSIKDLMYFLEEEADAMKKTYDDSYNEHQEDSRQRAEKLRKVRKAFSNLLGYNTDLEQGNPIEVDAGGLKVLVNPDPEIEVDLFEQTSKTLEYKLLILQNIKKSIEPLSDLEDVTIKVAFNNDLPTKIILDL
jgi:hypothetical protein